MEIPRLPLELVRSRGRGYKGHVRGRSSVMVLLVRVVEGWGATEEWGGSTGGQEGVRLGEGRGKERGREGEKCTG